MSTLSPSMSDKRDVLPLALRDVDVLPLALRDADATAARCAVMAAASSSCCLRAASKYDLIVGYVVLLLAARDVEPSVFALILQLSEWVQALQPSSTIAKPSSVRGSPDRPNCPTTRRLTPS